MRANTLEDIGALALRVHKTVAERSELSTCRADPDTEWCDPCRERQVQQAEVTRAKNTLLRACRAYEKRTP